MKPLDIGARWWGLRWAHVGRSYSLHRVAEVDLWALERDASAPGSAVCGRAGELCIPGIFSRMGSPRCARCCAVVGIPRGHGAPFNVLVGEAKTA